MGDSPFCLGSIYIVLDAYILLASLFLRSGTKIPGFVPFVLFIKFDCLRRTLTHPVMTFLDGILVIWFCWRCLEYEFLNKPDYDSYPPVSKPFWPGLSSRDTFVERYRYGILLFWTISPIDLKTCLSWIFPRRKQLAISFFFWAFPWCSRLKCLIWTNGILLPLTLYLTDLYGLFRLMF